LQVFSPLRQEFPRREIVHFLISTFGFWNEAEAGGISTFLSTFAKNRTKKREKKDLLLPLSKTLDYIRICGAHCAPLQRRGLLEVALQEAFQGFAVSLPVAGCFWTSPAPRKIRILWSILIILAYCGFELLTETITTRRAFSSSIIFNKKKM
jgi:hypothetical protein